MATVDSVNVEITGDSSSLESASDRGKNALARLNRQVGVSVNGLSVATARQRAFTNNVRNASFQLNDFAVQVASGTSATVALSQQLPQVIQGFGTIGAVASALAAIAIPALAMAISNAEGAAASFEDALESLTSIQNSLEGATEILTMNVEELTEKYGTASQVVRQFAMAQAEAMVAQARARLGEQLQDISRAISDYATDVNGVFLPAQRNLSAELGISRVEAFELAQALGELNAAPTFETQQEALQNIDSLLQQFGINAEQLPPTLNNALIELRNMAIAANELEAASARALEAARSGIPETVEDERIGRRRGLSEEEKLQRELELFRESLLTREQLQIESYARQQEMLLSAKEQELLTEQEYNEMLSGAARQHSLEMARIKQHEASMVVSAQTGMYSALGNLLGAFAGKSKAAAVAQIAINKALSIAQIIQNTAVAQMRALAELGPVAGPPAAAKIGLYGKVQSALVAATGLAQAAGALGGGGASAIGASINSGASTSENAAIAGGAGASPTNVAIQLTGGDMFSRDQVIMLINNINEAVEDGARIRVV